MVISTVLTEVAEKRRLISLWLQTAISKTQAEQRGLVQLSKLTRIRNWSCREALYEFAEQAAQTQPVLVNIDPRHFALYHLPPAKAVVMNEA